MGDQKAIDLEKRDPHDLVGQLELEFESVIPEPDSTHSIDCVYKISYLCFTCSKNCCYKFMTFLCGICIALYWGCEFACITFDIVWCHTPSIKICQIYTTTCKRYFDACLNCCLGTLCENCGLFFSKINVSNSK